LCARNLVSGPKSWGLSAGEIFVTVSGGFKMALRPDNDRDLLISISNICQKKLKYFICPFLFYPKDKPAFHISQNLLQYNDYAILRVRLSIDS